MDRLAASGIDLDEITAFLQTDGVKKFADSFDQMLDTIESRRESILEPA
jgi:hypothetical protein